MPPPRKHSSNDRSRRSRSYSPKPSHRKRSRSRSRSPKKRSRSRSPHRKHSTKSKHTSRSPHNRSRSPKRRSRSPKRRSRSPKGSQSPHYPVKRPADSSGKRTSYRSRSRSRTPTKRHHDDRYHREDSPRQSSGKGHRSPSPRRQSPSSSSRRRSQSPYCGKVYMDKPSSSKQPLFPVEKKRDQIDLVKIVDLGPKQKLDKRFETLEQIAQGGFDFEENITIGIYRGPQHLELDEDVPVNYDFNPKTFVMLFPKRDFSKPIFDRDEIKAFHHDDILDEEAYIEKRTITVKPSEKPKPKWMDEYKITVGQSREGYGDRRMVQDSRSRRQRSRSPDYEPKIRLDPKPDPRYERLYRDQQRQEHDFIHEDIQRNPNDLRFSIIKRKSDTDRDRDRDRDRDSDRGRDGGRFDARSRIEARRHDDWRDDSPERRDRRDSHGSPGRSYGDKRKSMDEKQDLPDFKNRPDDGADKRQRQRWGHCELCDVSLYSEQEAHDHVSTFQHRSNESFNNGNRNRSNATRSSSDWPRDRRESPNKYDRPIGGASRFNTRPGFKRTTTPKHIWVIGTGEMNQCRLYAQSISSLGRCLGLLEDNIQVHWYCRRNLHIETVDLACKTVSKFGMFKPNVIVIHVGGCDFLRDDFVHSTKQMVNKLYSDYPDAKLVWSQLIPRWTGQKDSNSQNKGRIDHDDELASYVLDLNGAYIRYPDIALRHRSLYKTSKDGDLNLTDQALEIMVDTLIGAFKSILFRGMKICPDLENLTEKVNKFVAKNIAKKNKFAAKRF